MGLTSALNTSLNGLTLNETTIDVLGNNIANAGTNGFKASNVLFTTQLARTLSVGSRATTSNGGTNPRQIGLGATTASIQKDFAQGSITNSTSPSDLAIQGDGLFVVRGNDGNVYTRNGNFALNSESLLINSQGLMVQGYGVDDNFNLITTQLADLRIDLGNLNIAQETRNISLGGALLPTGELGTQGAVLTTAALTDFFGGGAIDANTSLADVRDAGGNALFTVGETLSFSPRKGSRKLPELTLGPIVGPTTGANPYVDPHVAPGTTVGDLLTLMNDALGLHSGGTVPNDGTTGTQPGVSVVGGVIQVVGNMGAVNDLSISFGDLQSNGNSVSLAFNKSQTANGESAITDFVVFDSLGEAVTLKMTSVLESRTSTSTTFRWMVDSFDDSRENTAIATGTISFDGNGHVTAGGIATFSIERADSAANNMQITANFNNISGISSQTAGSTLTLDAQDGSDPGVLTNFVIDETGIINGVFDNGIIRTLGQIVLARFSNPLGLLEAGGGTFREGVSSGTPFLTTPGNFGAGSLRSGAIELSNTDIGRSLVDLIVASTNYRGNARVISSVQQLVDELLVLGR